MSLVAVMLTDLMDRKFLPRLPAANQEEEDVKAVQEVEACLLRWVRVQTAHTVLHYIDCTLSIGWAFCECVDFQ